MYIELAMIKHEKDLQGEKIALGDIIRQALREWLDRERQKKTKNM